MGINYSGLTKKSISAISVLTIGLTMASCYVEGAKQVDTDTPGPTVTTQVEPTKRIDPLLESLPDSDEYLPRCNSQVEQGTASLWNITLDDSTIDQLIKFASDCYGGEKGLYAALYEQGAVSVDEDGWLVGHEDLKDTSVQFFAQPRIFIDGHDAELLKGYKPFILNGSVFFDKDGDCKQQLAKESGLEGVDVCATVEFEEGSDDVFCTETNPEGSYEIQGFLGDRDYFRVGINLGDNPRFEYIRLADDTILYHDQVLTLKGDQTQQNFPVTVGFLDKPFLVENSKEMPFISSYTDHDPARNSVRNWIGDTTLSIVYNQNSWDSVKPGTGDQHQGTDFAMPQGTKLIAAAPGRIINSTCGYEEMGCPRYVRMAVDIIGDPLVYLISYGHNSKNIAKQSQEVVTGQVLALSGSDGNTFPHVHFGINAIPREVWEEVGNSPELFEYLDQNSIVYSDGSTAWPEYDPFLNELWLQGSYLPGFNEKIDKP